MEYRMASRRSRRPGSNELTGNWFKDFDAQDRAKIGAGNAQRLYNM